MIVWYRDDPLSAGAGFLNDLYLFNPATTSWQKLAPNGSIPSPRQLMGFAATPDGKLYAFGGSGNSGKKARVRIL